MRSRGTRPRASANGACHPAKKLLLPGNGHFAMQHAILETTYRPHRVADSAKGRGTTPSRCRKAPTKNSNHRLNLWQLACVLPIDFQETREYFPLDRYLSTRAVRSALRIRKAREIRSVILFFVNMSVIMAPSNQLERPGWKLLQTSDRQRPQRFARRIRRQDGSAGSPCAGSGSTRLRTQRNPMLFDNSAETMSAAANAVSPVVQRALETRFRCRFAA